MTFIKQSLFKKTVFLLLIVLWFSVASSQALKDVRINEIQIVNTNGLKDKYGQTVSWIELFNTGYGKVDVGGCLLKVNEQTYRIPKGSPNTVMPARGYLLFYANGDTDKGVFYTNFALENTDYVLLCAANHQTTLDSLPFDRSQILANQSYGWFEDENGKEKTGILPSSTPGTSNITQNKTPRGELFLQTDPTGIVITITAIGIVAIALSLLYLVFRYMGKYFVHVENKRKNVTLLSRTKQPI